MRKTVNDIPSGFGVSRSLREIVDEVVSNPMLDYDGKRTALLKLMPKHEAERILGADPMDAITLKDQLGEEVLFLVVQKRYFDKIMSGEKREEYRHLSEKMPGRYTYKAKDGRRYLRPYGKIRFAVGYHKKRDMALVEVNGITCDGECITFKLGRIIEYKPKE